VNQFARSASDSPTPIRSRPVVDLYIVTNSKYIVPLNAHILDAGAPLCYSGRRSGPAAALLFSGLTPRARSAVFPDRR
jgi:hypothetical protein